MKHTWAFTLLLGCVVGVFGTLLVVDTTHEAPAAGAPGSVAPQALPATSPDPATPRALDPALDDAALARELEEANFERDWGHASAVATVLRERQARQPGALPAASPTADGPPSLLLLDHAYQRAALAIELASHDNPATRVAASDLPPEEREARLIALLVNPPVGPGEDIVRADAALFLARMGRPRARQALFEFLEKPERSTMAALALVRGDDPLAIDALLRALESDRDPAQRCRIADALAEAPALVAGELVPAALARVARTDREVEVRLHAIGALARADLAASPSAREALTKLLDDDAQEEVVRLAVVAALRAHAKIALVLPPDLVTALDRQLDRTSGQLRSAVALALGDVATTALLERLEGALLQTTAPDERQALLEAVARVRQRSVKD